MKSNIITQGISLHSKNVSFYCGSINGDEININEVFIVVEGESAKIFFSMQFLALI